MRFGICGTKRTVQKMRCVCIVRKGLFEVCYLWVKTTVDKIAVSIILLDHCMRFVICGTKRTVQKMRGVCIYHKVGMFEVCLSVG